MKGFLANLKMKYPCMKFKMTNENPVYNTITVDLMHYGESFSSVFSELLLDDIKPNSHYEPRVEISFLVFDYNRRTRTVGRQHRVVGATLCFVTKEVVAFSGSSFGHDEYNDRFYSSFYSRLIALFEGECKDTKNYMLHTMNLKYFKRCRSVSCSLL